MKRRSAVLVITIVGAIGLPSASEASVPSSLPKISQTWGLFRGPVIAREQLTAQQHAFLVSIEPTLVRRVGPVNLDQARSVAGGSEIAVPGSLGLWFVATVSSTDRGAWGGAFGPWDKSLYGGFGGSTQTCSKNTPFVDDCLDADGGRIDFFQLVPDGVKSAIVAGTRFDVVDNVLYGTIRPIAQAPVVDASFALNIATWTAAAQATAKKAAAKSKAAKKEAARRAAARRREHGHSKPKPSFVGG